MTARPDLASLARDMRAELKYLRQWLHPSRMVAAVERWLKVVESEPAAEADGPQSTAALALNLSQELHEHGNHAWAREVEAIWRTMSAQEHALAAAAPLFEAAHALAEDGTWRGQPMRDVVALSTKWARSKAGQRWKAGRK